MLSTTQAQELHGNDGDFDQFIKPLQSLPRKIPEPTKHGNSMFSAIDKEVLIQALEQESLLSFEEEFEQAIITAHAENVSAGVEAIALCIANNSSPTRLLGLQRALKLPIVEI